MQIVSQKIGTIDTSMAVKNTEICSFFPLPFKAMLRPRNVEDNGYTIFIILTDRALISRCSICLDVLILLLRMLCPLEIGDGM